MKNTSKAFAISTAICFGLGIGFFLYFHFLEYQARQKLPAEMRTPEAIQSYYDGSMTKIEPNAENGLSKTSAADAFQVRSVSQERFVENLGKISEEQLADISEALAVVLKIYV